MNSTARISTPTTDRRTRHDMPPWREFCRRIALDPQRVLTTFPNVAALIDELGAS